MNFGDFINMLKGIPGSMGQSFNAGITPPAAAVDNTPSAITPEMVSGAALGPAVAPPPATMGPAGVGLSDPSMFGPAKGNPLSTLGGVVAALGKTQKPAAAPVYAPALHPLSLVAASTPTVINWKGR